MPEKQSPSTGSAHVKRAVWVLAFAVSLVALGLYGYINPDNLVTVEALFDHVYVFGVGAAVLGGWALGRLAPRKWLRVLIWALTALVACAWALYGIGVTQTFGWREVVAEVPAPDRPYEAVVTLTAADLPDPAWVISIRQTGRLLAQQWEVGCISGDDPRYGFRKASWADEERLRLSLNGRTVTVRVDPATGEPTPVSGKPWGC